MVSAPAYTLQAPHDNIDLFKYQPETVGAVGARDVTSLITIQMFPPSHADYGGYLLPPFLPLQPALYSRHVPAEQINTAFYKDFFIDVCCLLSF